MKTYAYSIFDSKADHYSTPQYFINDDVAIRAVTAAVNDPKHDYGRTPEDYNLFVIAKFDDETGEQESMVPTHLTSLHLLKN